MGIPGASVVKNLPVNAGDTRHIDSVPESGRSPGEGNGNLVFLLENSIERGAWWATVNEVAKSQTQLSN